MNKLLKEVFEQTDKYHPILLVRSIFYTLNPLKKYPLVWYNKGELLVSLIQNRSKKAGKSGNLIWQNITSKTTYHGSELKKKAITGHKVFIQGKRILVEKTWILVNSAHQLKDKTLKGQKTLVTSVNGLKDKTIRGQRIFTQSLKFLAWTGTNHGKQILLRSKSHLKNKSLRVNKLLLEKLLVLINSGYKLKGGAIKRQKALVNGINSQTLALVISANRLKDKTISAYLLASSRIITLVTIGNNSSKKAKELLGFHIKKSKEALGLVVAGVKKGLVQSKASTKTALVTSTRTFSLKKQLLKSKALSFKGTFITKADLAADLIKESLAPALVMITLRSMVGVHDKYLTLKKIIKQGITYQQTIWAISKNRGKQIVTQVVTTAYGKGLLITDVTYNIYNSGKTEGKKLGKFLGFRLKSFSLEILQIKKKVGDKWKVWTFIKLPKFKKTDQKSSQKQYIFSISEAAKLLGISTDTLRNWEEKGKIIPQRTKGGSRRYYLNDLKQLLAEKNPYLAQNLSSLFKSAPTFKPRLALNFLVLFLIFALTFLTTAGLLSFRLQQVRTLSSAQTNLADRAEAGSEMETDGVVLAAQTSSNPLEQIINFILFPFKVIGENIQLAFSGSQKVSDNSLSLLKKQFDKLASSSASLEKRILSLELLRFSPKEPTSATTTTIITTALTSLPKSITYIDLIGKTIIDSYGNIYPANGVKASIGTSTNKYYGLYLNRFQVDTGGNLTVDGKTTLGSTADDTVKFNGRIGTDIIPSSNGGISLGDSDHYFKNGYINNINASSVGTTSLTTGTISTTGNVGVGGSLSITNAIRFNNYDCSGLTNGGTLTTDSSGNLICAADDSGSSSSQTPWTSDINGGGFNLSNVGTINTNGNVGVGGSLTVTSGTALSSSLSVTGNSQLSTLTTSGNVGLGASLNLTATDGLTNTRNLNVLGTSSLGTAYGLTLTVSGNTGIGATATITGLTFSSGGLRVNGFSDLTGNVGVGTSLTTQSAAILNSLSVLNGATLGTAYVTTLTTTGNVGIGASLNVTAANGIVNTQSLNVVGGSSLGTAYATSLTTTGNVGIGASLNVVATNGLINTTGLNVTGISNLVGNVGIGASLNLTATDGLTNTRNLNVLGTSSLGTAFASILTTSGNLGIGGSLTTTGLDYATGGLRVNGLSDLTGNVGIGASLNVVATNGLINTTGLNVSKSSSLGTAYATTLTTTGNVGIGLSLTTQSAASLNTLNVVGISSLNGVNAQTINTAGNVGVGASLTVTGLGVFNGGVSTNTIQATGNVGIGGSLTLSTFNSCNQLKTTSTGVVTCGVDGGLESVQVFSSNGTYNAPGITTHLVVELVGGGGGGAGSNAALKGGGGGGAGGYSEKLIKSFVANETVTVGTGGAGGVNGNSGSVGVGSSFGTIPYLTATAGVGGSSPANNNFAGGPGGVGSGGDVNQTGGGGVAGGSTAGAGIGGAGGASFFGGGGGGIGAAGTGNAGAAPGSGGGGGVGAGATGGSGAAGVVIVWEYSGNAGSDYAELYDTKSDVSAADLVSVSNESITIDPKSLGAGLSNLAVLQKANMGDSLIGVVSTAPGQTIGQEIVPFSKHPLPIALSGRVPVKVNTENGAIVQGDKLTTSSTPGVAAKSIRAGPTIGTAMEDFDGSSCSPPDPPSDGSTDPPACQGQINVFVNTSYSLGARTKELLGKQGLDIGNLPKSLDVGKILLAQLITEKKDIVDQSKVSEVATDRMIAGLEVITPRVVADEVVTNKISLEGNLGIGTSELGQIGVLGVKNNDLIIGTQTSNNLDFLTNNNVVATFDTNGNLGIGTSSPTSLFQIVSGNNLIMAVTSTGNVGIGTSVTNAPLTVGQDNSPGNGAYLTAGGVWTNSSSGEFKENFTPLNYQDILEKISQLDIKEWNYKIEDSSIKHIGPIGEDFYSIFGIGNDSKHISTVDPAGIALAGIKGLKEQTDTKISSLDTRISALEQASKSAALIQIEPTPTPSQSPSATSSAQVNNSSLNLTPPDILLASSSASLTDLSVQSEATISGQLTAYEGTFQSSLKSLGETILGHTIIAGDLSVDGTLSINGTSISTANTLYLQNQPLAENLDIFNGKVKVDKDGKLTVQKLEVAAKTLGTATIPVGQTQVSIASDQITDKSKVFITAHKPVAIGVIAKDVAGKSFTVEIDKGQDAEVVFDWWIVDQLNN